MASRAAKFNEWDFLSAAFERRRIYRQSQSCVLSICHIGIEGVYCTTACGFYIKIYSLLRSLLTSRGFNSGFFFVCICVPLMDISISFPLQPADAVGVHVEGFSLLFQKSCIYGMGF